MAVLTPIDQGRVLRDGNGVAGKVHVSATGAISVHFRYRYRFDGQQKEVALGAWPRDTLNAIREKHQAIKLRVSLGADPNGQKQAVRQQITLERALEKRLLAEHTARVEQEQITRSTFRQLCDAWLEHGVNRKCKKRLKLTFEKNILPSLGEKRVHDVSDSILLEVLQAIISSGRKPTALAHFGELHHMFKWGKRGKPWRDLIDVLPTELIDLDRLFGKGYVSLRTRTLSEDEVRDLNLKVAATRETPDRETWGRVRHTPLGEDTEAAIWIYRRASGTWIANHLHCGIRSYSPGVAGHLTICDAPAQLSCNRSASPLS
ncbi:integrase arm-type DNA-binding domain-containing protein [Paraburkholderia sp. HC6.4b]|uniref:integrase arm-type DNA-binding domain-containing protein n=1 Tax=Paraburkholderia sp. HC6.4b TaxID=2723095 RepID=UPI0039064DBF